MAVRKTKAGLDSKDGLRKIGERLKARRITAVEKILLDLQKELVKILLLPGVN